MKPLAEQVSGRMRLALWVLAGAVGVVMLIVCANLSNLLLARTASRHKEIAIRSALGAGRGRLMAQMLTEGVVLSCSGAVLGLLLAIGGHAARWRELDAVSIPLLRGVQTDATALGFTLAIAILTGILFGLAPALQARSAALHDALKDATRGSTEGRARRWVRSALVVSEIAFACVLLVGAGLLIRSLIRVLDVDMGFEPARAATIRVDPDSRYTTRANSATRISTKCCAASRRSPAWKPPASPMRSRSGATAPGARGRRESPTNEAAAPRRSSASSATAIPRPWAFRC